MPGTEIIERFTRFDRSLIWRMHGDYWAQRGLAAFDSGEVPSLATTNWLAARRHAAFYLTLVGALEEAGAIGPDDALRVFEIGGGDGRFAANFLRALSEESDASRRLLGRTHYLLSDGAELSLLQAAKSPRLGPWIAAGKVETLAYGLDQAGPIPPGAPVVMVVANYVASVIPTVHLQRHADGTWRTLMAQLSAPQEGAGDPAKQSLSDVDIAYRWTPVQLESCFDDPRHAEVVRAALGAMPEATLAYPADYLDFLSGLAPRLADGAAVVTTDCGFSDTAAFAGHFTRPVQRYGGSLAEGVSFAVFDAFAQVFGWQAARTDAPLGELHVAALSPGVLTPQTRAAFDAELGDGAVMALMDLRAAGAYATDDDEPRRALRAYLRCVEADPYDAEYRYRIGVAAIEIDRYDFAIHHLLLAWEEDLERRWDVAFELGRAHWLSADLPAALRWYQRSLEHAPHAVTWGNMAAVLHALGRSDEAAAARAKAEA